MWDNLYPEFEGELGPGERILWAGRPRGGLAFRPGDIFLIPFSLMWGGFAVLWETGVIVGGAPFFFWLWGIPFVLVGLYLIAGRFFVDAYVRGRTRYSLSNERVIIVSGLFGRNITSLMLRTLVEINLNRKGDGSGTITFGPTHPGGWMYGGAGWPGSRRYAAPAFEMIQDAKGVYAQIRAAQKEIASR